MNRIEINVTQQDIDEAEQTPPTRSRCETCAVARAATRAFGYPVSASYVYINRIDSVGHLGPPLCKIPDNVRGLMSKLDLRHHTDGKASIQPFTFTVELEAKQ